MARTKLTARRVGIIFEDNDDHNVLDYFLRSIRDALILQNSSSIPEFFTFDEEFAERIFYEFITKFAYNLTIPCSISVQRRIFQLHSNPHRLRHRMNLEYSSLHCTDK